MRECLEQHKVAIMMMMVYYSNLRLGRWSSRTMKALDLEMFRNMVKDFNLIDPQAPTCRSLNELVSVFVVRPASACLLYTSPSPRDRQKSRMPSSA